MTGVRIVHILFAAALALHHKCQARNFSVNTATVIFGSISPNSAATPDSCVTLTAVAEHLLTETNPTSRPKPSPWTASAEVCSLPAMFALDFSTEADFFNDDDESKHHAPNSTAPPVAPEKLAIRVQATQSTSQKGVELQWSAMLALERGTVGNIDINMQLAVATQSTATLDNKASSFSSFPHTTSSTTKQRPVLLTPKNNNSSASSSSSVSEIEFEYPHQQQYPPPPQHTTAAATVYSTLMPLLFMALGIVTGRKLSSNLSSSSSSPKRILVSTCDAACSPFVSMAAAATTTTLIATRLEQKFNRDSVKGDRGTTKNGTTTTTTNSTTQSTKKKHRWMRDHEGRLQRGTGSHGEGAAAHKTGDDVFEDTSASEE